MSFWEKITALFRRKQLDAEMAEELRTHLERRTEANLGAGMSPDEARYAAQRQFGGVEQIHEHCRDQRSARWLEDFMRDVQYGGRALRKNPGFTATAVLILALGIGANTAVFSLMHRMLFAHLPVEAPEQLMVVERHNLAQSDLTTFPFSFFENLASDKNVFDSAIARTRGTERVTIDTESGGKPAKGELVSGNYFAVLGVRPHLGRLLTAADDITPGAHPVVVLSYHFWERNFGGDPAIVGKIVRLTGLPMTIIGVSPPEFNGLDPSQDVDLRLPLAMLAEIRGGRANPNQRSQTEVQIVARLKQGVSPMQAQTVASARWRQFLDAEQPATAQNRQIRESERITLRPAAAGYGQTRQKFAPTLRVLIATTGAVLVVACFNLAGLLLARSATRRHEFALRLALGASTGRLVRQLLAEGMLLALAGAGLGALIAFPSSATLWRILAGAGISPDLPAWPEPAVLLSLVVTAAVCGICFGLAPAWYFWRRTFATGLKSGSRTGAAPSGGKFLVCAQVAASVVVLAGAGLFLRSIHALRTTEVGFDSEHLLLAALSPKNAGRNDAESLAFFREVRERVAALPGVTGATYSMVRALAGNNVPVTAIAEGVSLAENSPVPVRNVVGPDYFHTFGISLMVGRDFTTGDDAGAPKVAIVSERFAKLYFPGQDPIGRKIGQVRPEYTIVGVARDVRHGHVREPARPQWYLPYEQFSATKYLDLCVRTDGDPEAMRATIHAAIAGVDRGVASFDVRTQSAQLEQLLVTERMLATLASLFGATVVVLTAVGLYGLLAFIVAQQRREIGIRMALGARPVTVLRNVLVRGMRLTLVGIVAGMIAAFFATQLGREPPVRRECG
jgi:predicted permease